MYMCGYRAHLMGRKASLVLCSPHIADVNLHKVSHISQRGRAIFSALMERNYGQDEFLVKGKGAIQQVTKHKLHSLAGIEDLHFPKGQEVALLMMVYWRNAAQG